MKKIFLILCLMLLGLVSDAAMISFRMTNSVTLLPDTNVIKVFDCGPVQADGTVYTTGVGRRVQPDSSGYALIQLPQNNYLATNAFLGRGYIFRAPLDSSTNNIYASAGPSCLISGLNYFVNLVVGDATNQAVTLNQITNATGFPLLSPTQITNIAQAVTNGFTSIVFSNPASFISALTATGIVQSLAPSFVQATNIAQQQASNIVSSYTTTNSFLSASNYLATNSIAQVLAQGALSTNFTLSASNSVLTNLVGQLNASSNALQSSINASNAILVSNLGSVSNTLWLGKQPASGILSNLALTGAWTNTLVAGTNILITTNLSNPFIVYVHATNQTFLTNNFTSIVYSNPSTYFLASQAAALTNGFVQSSITNGLASLQTLTNYAYPIGNPSNFVTASITNGFVSSAITNTFATTNWVAQNFLTNAAVASNFLNSAKQPASTTLSNLSLTGAYTNGIGAGLNVYLSTNLGIVSINASNQTWLTNGLVIPSTNGFVTSAITNGLATTNYVQSYSDTNGAAQAAYNSSTNNAAQLYLAKTNGSAYSLAAVNQLALGSATNFLVSTNLIGVTGGGSTPANGTYQYDSSGFANTWTNTFSTNAAVLYSGGNYYIQSNGVSLYTSATVNGAWSLVNGVNPIPAVAYGSYWNMNGVIMLGFVSSTNLFNQITNAIALYGNTGTSGTTNFQLTGVVQSWTTNNQFSTAGTNVIIDLIAQYGVNPTNGISSATATNIAAGLITTATNSLWAGVTNRGAVQWGGTTNLTILARPATLYYFVTNGTPQYGILNTN